ncbi:MAG: B12-binding domain-containing radical SAM protein [Spirochaetota bacterium]
MNILFIQLPLVDHGWNYIQGNISYAPATLAAYLQARHGKSHSPALMPMVLENFASERVLLRYILGTRPDMLCFTCYLWNVERVLTLAAMVKEADRNIQVALGGPEISEGSWALSERRTQVDLFVSGEGEWFLDRLADGTLESQVTVTASGNPLLTQPIDALMDAGRFVEPFSRNWLTPMFDGSISFEMTRGCPYRCSYCFYSKNCYTVREQPFDLLTTAIEKGLHTDVSEIYILSPTFNRTPKFKEKLRQLADVNRGIRLHTEMRADGIGPQEAHLMAEAGFTSCEVGLQTLTPSALERVGRRTHVEKELAGMRYLADAGLELQVGIIPALPGDTPEGFLNTIGRLVEEGFGEFIEFYPLMLLPGTRIRDEAPQFARRYQSRPPYYLLESDTFSFEQVRTLADHMEEETGISITPLSLPDFTMEEEGILTRGARFNGDEPSSWEDSRYAHMVETSVFSFYIGLNKAVPLQPRLESLFTGLPTGHTLYNVILESGSMMDEEGVRAFLEGREDEGFLSRLHVFSGPEEGQSIQVYHVTSNLDVFMQAVRRCRVVTPILRITRDNAQAALKLLSDAPSASLVTAGSYDTLAEDLTAVFADDPELLLFEEESEQALFLRAIGEEYVKLPFTFRVAGM